MNESSHTPELSKENSLLVNVGIATATTLIVLAGNFLMKWIERRYQPTISSRLVASWIDEDYFTVQEITNHTPFAYEISVIDESGNEYSIFKNGFSSPLVVQAIYSLEGVQLGTVLDSPEARRLLRPTLEAVLTNVPGTYSYLTADKEQCSMDRMRCIGFEYRVYADKAGQHEINNALVSMDSAVEYVKSRIEDVAGRDPGE